MQLVQALEVQVAAVHDIEGSGLGQQFVESSNGARRARSGDGVTLASLSRELRSPKAVPGAAGLAAPVFDTSGKAVAALLIGAPVDRFEHELPELRKHIKEVAANASGLFTGSVACSRALFPGGTVSRRQQPSRRLQGEAKARGLPLRYELHVEIGLETLEAGLAAVPRLFNAPERRFRRGNGDGIDAHHSRLDRVPDRSCGSA
jgi:hypothetical protein